MRGLDLKKMDYLGGFQFQVTEKSAPNCSSGRFIGSYIRSLRQSEDDSIVGCQAQYIDTSHGSFTPGSVLAQDKGLFHCSRGRVAGSLIIMLLFVHIGWAGESASHVGMSIP